MKTYRVLRQMDGDRPYKPGETRQLSEADAAHLVRLGVLVEVKAESEPSSMNKVELAPANKARPPRTRK